MKKISVKRLIQYWCLASVAMFILATGVLHLLKMISKANLLDLLVICFIIPALPIVIESLARISKELGLNRRIARSSILPKVAPGRRAFNVNGKQSQLLASTKPVMITHQKRSRVINADRLLAPNRWAVYLVARYQPIERATAVIINDKIILQALNETWNRQASSSTKHIALSRPYFVQRAQLLNVNEYYALVGILSSLDLLWGRGATLSGVLICLPDRALNVIKNNYSPGTDIFV